MYNPAWRVSGMLRATGIDLERSVDSCVAFHGSLWGRTTHVRIATKGHWSRSLTCSDLSPCLCALRTRMRGAHGVARPGHFVRSMFDMNLGLLNLQLEADPAS